MADSIEKGERLCGESGATKILVVVWQVVIWDNVLEVHDKLHKIE
jgi:hypothetical protein